MNTNTLKRFAQGARRKLLEQVAARMDYVLTTDSAALREKAESIQKLKEEIARSSKSQVIDKVAYTWFNRFMALRFMDANDSQPIGIRIVSPKPGHTLPQLLEEAKAGHVPEELKLNRQQLLDLLDGRITSKNSQNEAYQLLLVAACNHLHTIFPFLFEKINHYTELLLPEDLNSEFSILNDVVEGMSEEDCQEVEIIGWLYQFYISEKKDEVFASKGKVKKEDIPAATQLFTPRWIVEYMVQNTLGKLWLQNRPDSRLREYMPYFIESPSVAAEDYIKVGSVEEIRLLDQACGSGHILVYAFELFTKIYEEEGYNTSEIPALIIQKNLFGFEIDERAAQLAGLALLMKARSYQRRLFRKSPAIRPNILRFSDLRLCDVEIKDTLALVGIQPSDALIHDLHNMRQATNLGSLIIPQAFPAELWQALKKIQAADWSGDIFLKGMLKGLMEAFQQLRPMAEKYHCVVDNPPYMSDGKMNNNLSNWVKTNYPSSKTDLMACFMDAGVQVLYKNGFLGMINQHSWMFLRSYTKLRRSVINHLFIETLLHLGPRTFPEIGGEIVQNVAFSIWNRKLQDKGAFLRLVDYNNTEEKRIKTIQAIQEDNCDWIFRKNQKEFGKLPESPFAYWLSKEILSEFKGKNVGDFGESKAGIVSGNDALLIRFWFEISFNNISFNLKKYSKSISEEFVPINKGGPLRKYFGNQEHILNLDKLWDGKSTNSSVRRGNTDFYFRKAITWSYISNVKFGFRQSENVVFATQSPTIFITDPENYYSILGLLNSKISEAILPAINPTVSLLTSNVESIPSKIDSLKLNEVTELVPEQVFISKEEWRSFELSWEFNKNEVIRLRSNDLEETFELYCQYWRKKFLRLHQNEEELNRIFIDFYGLRDELTPEVPLEDITILKEETKIEQGELIFQHQEIMAQLVSYGVGCMVGRYSLDKEGLILANQGEGIADYLVKVGKSQSELSFHPDDDNIIPVLDGDWFEDDIVGRCHAFLKAAFGSQEFTKNLTFLESCLGKDLRKYFSRDFYKDHIKRYKKRPIYWLFSSPKGHFQVLIYLHRYTPDTLNTILNQYLREFMEKLRSHREQLTQVTISGSAQEQNKALKEIERIDKMLLDCQEYEREVLYPFATERIEIDLDDGVLVNYNKFGKAVKEVKGLNDAKAKKKVRGFDWIDVSEIRD